LFVHPCVVEKFLEYPVEGTAAHSPALSGEYILVFLVYSCEVLFQESGGNLGDRNDPILSPFRLTNENEPVSEGDIADQQVRGLAHPKAG